MLMLDRTRDMSRRTLRADHLSDVTADANHAGRPRHSADRRDHPRPGPSEEGARWRDLLNSLDIPADAAALIAYGMQQRVRAALVQRISQTSTPHAAATSTHPAEIGCATTLHQML
jgi:hypothetical protein